MALLYFVLVVSAFQAFGLEPPLCSKFSFQEHLLEKVVKFDFKLDTMVQEITKTQAKVKKELHGVLHERKRMNAELKAFKADIKKRFSDAAKAMDNAVKDFEVKIELFSKDLAGFQNNTSTSKKGLSVTYIRWGRTVCPQTAKLLYNGFASGTHYMQHGGTSDTVCLPKDPQFGKWHSGQYRNYLYNSEYAGGSHIFQSIFGRSFQDEDVPCALCQADEKVTVMMVPARMECYEGWQLEYSGYLMTPHVSHKGRSALKCVDSNPEAVPGQSADNNGHLFDFVEAGGTLPDPPYTRGKELTCAVCTK